MQFNNIICRIKTNQSSAFSRFSAYDAKWLFMPQISIICTNVYQLFSKKPADRLSLKHT